MRNCANGKGNLVTSEKRSKETASFFTEQIYLQSWQVLEFAGFKEGCWCRHPAGLEAHLVLWTDVTEAEGRYEGFLLFSLTNAMCFHYLLWPLYLIVNLSAFAAQPTRSSDFLWPSKRERIMPDPLWLTLHFQLGKQILCLFENQALGNGLNQSWQNTVVLFLVDLYMCVLYTYGSQKLFQWCSHYHIAPSSAGLPALEGAQEQQALIMKPSSQPQKQALKNMGWEPDPGCNGAGTDQWHLLLGQE